MNYSEKRTLVGRIVYIGLTLMAVTVLVVSMFAFFGGSKRPNDPIDPVVSGSESSGTTGGTIPAPTDTQPSTDALPPVTDGESSSSPTDAPTVDWSNTKVMMPVFGVIYKDHDLSNAVFSVTMNDYRVHHGVDIECSEGAEVVSCAYGTVTAVGKDPFMGTTVVIDHGDGLVSYYQNLSEKLAEDIEEGTEVYAGQLIGTVGESAIIEISDEPHLHFEMRLADKEIDPRTMLDYDEDAAANEALKGDK